MSTYLPIVPVERELEVLVLGWRIGHGACLTPCARCKQTPLTLRNGFTWATYAMPVHQRIANACHAVIKTGEPLTAAAYETSLTLNGDWERCGRFSYWSDMILSDLDLIAAPHCVEKAAYRLTRLGQSRIAVEQLVAAAEGHSEADSSALDHVRESVRQVVAGMRPRPLPAPRDETGASL